ncbi:MAG: TMEM175 family protein [Methylococcaceae bacterium]|nr:TMEM175 family protein [Methylococcaceae bacterium]MDZ4219140.1 TMEM175 family protein [Methylobacter sp.]MDP2393854.1 TMEM175 family protein [Methylococcaceae bacterium]MDP3017978.1 TMEM175 family protein [Methylococcaceae bacterium]MDP3391227.1 TMEM175 family protein [Methylococcaceae bacterium]
MPNESYSLTKKGLFSLERCNALTDGVFAIVITLLVLGIDVPSDHNFSEQGLYAFLERVWLELLIYGVSFWLAVTYWLQHTAIMHYYRAGTRSLVWLNLLFLFPVTLLPFVTELRGTYRYEELITVLFGGLQILIGLALIALWNHSKHYPQLLIRPIDDAFRKKVVCRMLISPILISVIAVALSFIDIHASAVFFMSIPLYYLSHRDIDQNWIDVRFEDE